jgi:D-serine deaminase-like pyridoxal phosphate-dependent protein
MKIKKPSLIVDLERVDKNIDRMCDKFKKADIQFRPHFKTHQSHFFANKFRKRGIEKCTVSSLEMAKYFARDGWNDISIAFPVNILEAGELNELASQIKLNILLDSVGQVIRLAPLIQEKIFIFIEVDTGYKRSGISVEKLGKIKQIIEAIEHFPQFHFIGFLSHSGQTYAQESKEAIIQTFQESKNKLTVLKNEFTADYPELILSMGDTPAASLVTDFTGVDEMRPGNFIFYDVMQYFLGACSLDQIAVAVYCPVVAKYPERNQVVIYGGGVHLSKENIRSYGKAIYGLVSLPDEEGFGSVISEAYVAGLSQEHGLIHLSTEEIKRIELGDLLAIYPVHSCMTVDLNKSYISLHGKQITKFRTY